MKLTLDSAQVFVPSGAAIEKALAATTHMAVGAHQDDLEIMAFAGIIACFQQAGKGFTGVVVTNGAGSPRDDVYKHYTDDQMRAIRIVEQKKAALVGEYAAQALLDHPSSSVKDASNRGPADDLEALLQAAKPQVVYTHNLADKHDTHVASALRLIEAIRRLPKEDRPKQLLGCEVWRDLDWLPDGDKTPMDVSAHENLQAALLGVFDSQVCGGKRYDLATMGRRRAHATYYQSHGVDETAGLNFAMDLTPLVEDDSLTPADLLGGYVNRFREEVAGRVQRFSG